MSLPALRDHTDAVIAAVGNTGLKVGDGEEPEGLQPGESYYVVHHLTGGHLDGTMARQHDDAQLPYQVSSFATGRALAEHLGDLARVELLDNGVTVNGRDVWPVRSGQLGGVQPRRETTTPQGDTLWHVPERYLVESSPE